MPSNVHVRYFATFCTTSGTISTIALILVWCKCHAHDASNRIEHSAVSHNLGSETKKATGMPLYMSIGHCGSILGSHLFPTTEAPRYLYVVRCLPVPTLMVACPKSRKGFAVTCGLILCCAITALAVTVSNPPPLMIHVIHYFVGILLTRKPASKPKIWETESWSYGGSFRTR